jgi:hypothetical protein
VVVLKPFRTIMVDRVTFPEAPPRPTDQLVIDLAEEGPCPKSK